MDEPELDPRQKARQESYKAGASLEAARRKRDETTISLRKAKKNEKLLKKRQMGTSSYEEKMVAQQAGYDAATERVRVCFAAADTGGVHSVSIAWRARAFRANVCGRSFVERSKRQPGRALNTQCSLVLLFWHPVKRTVCPFESASPWLRSERVSLCCAIFPELVLARVPPVCMAWLSPSFLLNCSPCFLRVCARAAACACLVRSLA